MSLRDKNRANKHFAIDESLGKILGQWSKERDSDIGRLNLSRAAARLRPEQKAQLIERLAEISLALLFVLDEEATPEN
jgi:hypothetical protein